MAVTTYARPEEWIERRSSTIFPQCRDLASALSTAEVIETVPDVVRRLVADGFRATAAGVYASGWLAASPAYVVGAMYAETGAGLQLDAHALRWWMHPEGWTEGLAVVGSPTVAVPAGHAWSGQPDVEVLGSSRAVAARCTAALIALVAPIVDRLHDVSRAGRPGLWHEVSDAIGGALLERPIAATAPEVQRLRDLIAVRGAPWKRLPRIELVDGPAGPVCVRHKGGCCLAYTLPPADPATAEAPEPPDPDDAHLAFEAAFPHDASAPDYCSTCRFRDFDDVVRRRMWWQARQADT